MSIVGDPVNVSTQQQDEQQQDEQQDEQQVEQQQQEQQQSPPLAPIAPLAPPVPISSALCQDEQRLHDPQPLCKTVVLYENERFQVTSFGWSKNGLMPTDRKHISTRSGKHGWPSLEAADVAMITHGWTWAQSAWDVEQNDESDTGRRSSTSEMNTDGEGWSYATNFGSIEESGTAVKGMTHFVRRRRRTRKQIFVGPSLIKGTCDHCDSAEVRQLSDCLLEALTQTSLHENPGEYSEVVTNRLKNTLHELLGLASRGQPFTDMAGVNKCIDKFFVTVINAKSAWAKLSSIVGADYLPEKLPERAVEVSTFSFPLEERREVARMLIRKYDTAFSYHCHKYNCGAGCTFALTPCPNLGCSEVLSAKYTAAHLDTCQFTPLACERNCGETVARKEMSCHLKLTCELRPVECPYACIGCEPDGLTVRALPNHLCDTTVINSHLALSLVRLTEQQAVIVSLNKKVNHLESTVSTQGRAIKLLQGGAAATAVAIKSSEQAAEEAGHREVKDLEKKLESKTRSMSKQVESLSKNVRTLELENAAQKAQLESLRQAESDV